jgi:hypothetical protein
MKMRSCGTTAFKHHHQSWGVESMLLVQQA